MSNDLAILPQFHAVAINATEMQASRENIQTWLEAKCAALKSSVAESYAALDAATRNNWRTAPLEGVFRREKQSLLYYGKLLEAVRAGYTIVPNMPVDIFAIRVKRVKPAASSVTGSSDYYSPNPRVANEEEQRLAVGEGRYESPSQIVTTTRKDVPNPTTGKLTHFATAKAVGFDDVEFPLAVAHSAVMAATERAMGYKIFDRIGMVNEVNDGKGDPIVLGQITYKRGYARKTASFLIAWYLDPRTL